jgi:hypothetical protein
MGHSKTNSWQLLLLVGAALAVFAVLAWRLARPAPVASSPTVTAVEDPSTPAVPGARDPQAMTTTPEVAVPPHPLPADSSRHGERSANAAIANGVVVYAETGQGVPWLDVQADGLSTATASDGTFRIGLRGEAPTRVRFLDDAIQFEKPLTLDPRSGVIADIRVPVRLGPTYVLKIRSEEKLDPKSLSARLVVGEPSFRTQWQALRAGDNPWVRFNALVPKESVGAAGAVLAVSTNDGLCRGRVSVPGIQGFFREPIEVELHAVGALSGRINLPADSPAVAVRLELDGTATPGLPMDRCSPAEKQPSAADETYRFAGLEPGHYRLTAYAEGFHPLIAEAEVLPGVVTQLDLDLRAPADTGTIHGRVLSGYGNAWRQPPVVELVSRATGRKVARTRLALQDSPIPAGADTFQGSFLLRNIPYGPYSITVVDLGCEGAPREIWGHCDVEVDRTEVNAELRYGRGLTEGPGAFEVRDARTHQAISSFDLVNFTVISDQDASALFNPLFAQVNKLSGQPVLSIRSPAQAHSDPARIRWMVAVDEHAPVWGDESAFQRANAGGPLKPHVVELERGWGGMAIVYREVPGARPIVMQDVAVSLDGQEKTRTDAEGLAFLSESTAPQIINVAKFGYHIVQALGVTQGKINLHARTFCFLIASD